MGWVDHGSVWRFDSDAAEPQSIALSDAKYLSLQSGSGDKFSAVHHWSGERLAVTVQTYEQPEFTLARMDVTDSTPILTGDHSAWESVPSVFLGYLNLDVIGLVGYFCIRIVDGYPRMSRLDWFHDGPYDFGYQGVITVDLVPGSGDLLFGVQRSSDLVLVDSRDSDVKNRIALANRLGNPHPIFSKHSNSLWAVDYDTLVRLDRRNWKILSEVLFQPSATGTRMFVGNIWLPANEEFIVVPRPGSGDVLIVEPLKFSVVNKVETGGQPLEAATSSGGKLVARDWKSGELIGGAALDFV